MTRVKIPGGFYGEIIKVTKGSISMGESLKADIATVKLDSGKRVRVILAECEAL